jgi:peroxiredoxin Q/BCP
MFNIQAGFYPSLTIVCLMIASAFVSVPSGADILLKEGDVAPEFSLPGSDGKQYSLSDFRDKSFVVIAFFPKAFTGG